MKHICFVTNELYPFSKGGIGRLVYNFIRSYNYTDCKYYILYENDANKIQKRQIEQYFNEEIDVKSYSNDCNELKVDDVVTDISVLSKSHNPYARSLIVFDKLLEFQNELHVEFNIIEFCDIFGLALCSIQAKKWGNFSKIRL